MNQVKHIPISTLAIEDKPQYKKHWLANEGKEVETQLNEAIQEISNVIEANLHADRAFYAISRRGVEDAAAVCNLINGSGKAYSPYCAHHEIYKNRELFTGHMYKAGVTDNDLTFVEGIHATRSKLENMVGERKPFGVNYQPLRSKMERISSAVCEVIDRGDDEIAYYKKLAAEKQAKAVEFEEKFEKEKAQIKTIKKNAKDNLRKLKSDLSQSGADKSALENSLRDEISEKLEEIDEFKKEIVNLRRDCARLRDERKLIKREKEEKRKLANRLEDQLNDLKSDYDKSLNDIRALREERGRLQRTMSDVRDDNRRLERKVGELDEGMILERDRWMDRLRLVYPNRNITTVQHGVDCLNNLIKRNEFGDNQPILQQRIRDLETQNTTLSNNLALAREECESNRKWAAEEKSKRSSTYCTAIKALGGGNLDYKGYKIGFLKARYDILVNTFIERWRNLERIERIASQRNIDVGHTIPQGLNNMINSTLRGVHIAPASMKSATSARGE